VVLRGAVVVGGPVVGETVVAAAVVGAEVVGGSVAAVGVVAPAGRQMSVPGKMGVSVVALFSANRSSIGTPLTSAMRSQ